VKKSNLHKILFFLSLFILSISYSQNVAPILNATGNQIYCSGSSLKIVTNMNITDPDDPGIDAIYIQISSGYDNAQDVLTLTGFHPTINSNWDSLSGKLTLTGIISQPTYSELISAIEDVEYSNNSPNPSGDNRTFSISVGQANYLPSNGHYYLFIPNIGVTWTNAKILAEASTYYGLQGYLATITAADESQLAGEQASGAGWIGGSDQETEGVWKWVTGPEAGTNMVFTYWNNNEPNNLGNEDYAHITAPGVGIPGSWNDLSNTGETSGAYQPKGYIVEYGGTAGDPILQISTSTTITIPKITNIVNATICGDGSLNLQATSNTGTVNWFDSFNATTPIFIGDNFATPVLTNTTIYYVSADSNCGDKVAVTATVTLKPIVNVTSTVNICEGIPSIVTAATTSGIVSWYDNQSSTTSIFSGLNFTIPDISENTIYYVEANDNGCFSDRIAVQVIVNPSPIVANENIVICADDNLILDAGIPNSTYLWSTGETTQTINYTGNGNYLVEITNSYGCTKAKSIFVLQYTNPQIENIFVNQLIATVEVSGFGEFEYSIDGINYQNSNIFNLPEGGIYTCYVRERAKGCGLDAKKFAAISYPQHFTPNNDNINDYWSIKGMDYFPAAQVRIFDRFGKFIIKLDINNQTWNGTINGVMLPSSDYWFVAKISDEFPEQKGHFTLKR
jgi:gliding motility-associated-like protein